MVVNHRFGHFQALLIIIIILVLTMVFTEYRSILDKYLPIPFQSIENKIV